MLKLATQPLSCCPNIVLAKGRQPIGASEVAPILLAPRPYKLCSQIIIYENFFFTRTETARYNAADLYYPDEV